MRRLLYLTLSELAGEWLLELRPQPVPIDRGCSLAVAKAVYIAVDSNGSVDYVGSTPRRRDVSGLNQRIKDHLLDPDRAEAWVELYVLPLKPETPPEEVESIEEAVGLVLRPSRNRRLPRRKWGALRSHR